MLLDMGSMSCLAPKLQWPPGWGFTGGLCCCLSPTCKVCAAVFKEEEGDSGDYHLYGTERCLQVSLFNEKQNNPSGTQSTVLWALWGKRAFCSFVSQNTASNYSSDYIFLASKISGFLETSFLFQRPFFLAFCHLFYRFLCFLFPHIHLCCHRFASAGEAEA